MSDPREPFWQEHHPDCPAHEDGEPDGVCVGCADDDMGRADTLAEKHEREASWY